MSNVLLISDSSQDYYWNPFVVEAEAVGVSIFLFEPRKLSSCCKIGISQLKTELDSRFSATRLSTDNEQCELSSKEIDLAWFLRPSSPTHFSTLSEIEQNFATIESLVAIDSFYSSLQCAWINSPSAVNQVEGRKLYQQIKASECGLLVPSTVITNDNNFIRSNVRYENVLIKAMGAHDISGMEDYHIYSQKVPRAVLDQSAEAIANCPIMLQEYIEKAYEYRVTVVDDNILACRIHSQDSESTKVDWRRYDFENVKHEKCSLPKEIEEGIFRFMAAVGLKFGAIDMIETPHGEFIFLEINPSGQWGWIEHHAKLPIAKSIANKLLELSTDKPKKTNPSSEQ